MINPEGIRQAAHESFLKRMKEIDEEHDHNLRKIAWQHRAMVILLCVAVFLLLFLPWIIPAKVLGW